MKLKISRQIFEKCSNIKSSVGAEVIQADGRTDRTKPKVTFHNFVNTHKNRKILLTISQHDIPPSSGEVVNEYSYASTAVPLLSLLCLHSIM